MESRRVANREMDEYYRRMMAAKSDEELVDSFNLDVNKAVWVSARASFHSALLREFEARGIDVSAIYDSTTGTGQLSRKIKLIGRKIIAQQ